MTDINYSRNTGLLDIEIWDNDTRYLNETGINTDRMRLPNRYDISKYYERFKTPSSYDEEGNPRYEKGRWKKKAEKGRPEISTDFEWQITYRFTDEMRNPYATPNGIKYGGKHITFRRLYLILCERFNGGRFFIDEYFDTVYPYSRAKEEVDSSLNDLKKQIISTAESVIGKNRIAESTGKLDRRIKGWQNLSSELNVLAGLAREQEELRGESLAKIVKSDIIKTIETGELPCQMFSVSLETAKKRKRAGLEIEPRFAATNQLIRHIQLFVDIGGHKKWDTKQGILV